jgi:5'-3' exonuclease
MGIKGLTALLSEHAPASIKEHDIKTLFGRKVAIDASMSIYQFLIAVRQKDGEMLTNDAGETTSHLMGLFYRTIRIVENGIKPAYVFDGKPPELKKGVVSRTSTHSLSRSNVFLSWLNVSKEEKRQRRKVKKQRRQGPPRTWTGSHEGL